MTEPILLEELLAGSVPDPDPERKVIACDDCRTVRLALTAAEDLGVVLVVEHDPTCPTFTAMSDVERTQMYDEGAIVHLTSGSA